VHRPSRLAIFPVTGIGPRHRPTVGDVGIERTNVGLGSTDQGGSGIDSRLYPGQRDRLALNRHTWGAEVVGRSASPGITESHHRFVIDCTHSR
jgi:hypothetical protein